MKTKKNEKKGDKEFFLNVVKQFVMTCFYLVRKNVINRRRKFL